MCRLRRGNCLIASYYDFINRLIKLDEKPRSKHKKRKPRKKHGKKKLPPKHPGTVKKLVREILKGRRLDRRPERLLQEIFAKVCVQVSVDLGLIPKFLSISGDGTCIETGASQYGVKACDCKDFMRLQPQVPTPTPVGWDSHKEQWFYGYIGCFISTYNKAERLDLPIYFRLLKQVDMIAFPLLSRWLSSEICTPTSPENFLSDSRATIMLHMNC